jgi:hypothetical protein
MTAKRVYIVIKRDYETGSPNFRDVFFSIEAAEKYISECKFASDYEIECFEETENGKSKEIYE